MSTQYRAILDSLYAERAKIDAAIDAIERLDGTPENVGSPERPIRKPRAHRRMATLGITDAIRGVFAASNGANVKTRDIVAVIAPMYGTTARETRMRLSAHLNNLAVRGEIEHVEHGVWRAAQNGNGAHAEATA